MARSGCASSFSKTARPAAAVPAPSPSSRGRPGAAGSRRPWSTGPRASTGAQRPVGREESRRAAAPRRRRRVFVRARDAALEDVDRPRKASRGAPRTGRQLAQLRAPLGAARAAPPSGRPCAARACRPDPPARWSRADLLHPLERDAVVRAAGAGSRGRSPRPFRSARAARGCAPRRGAASRPVSTAPNSSMAPR